MYSKLKDFDIEGFAWMAIDISAIKDATFEDDPLRLMWIKDEMSNHKWAWEDKQSKTQGAVQDVLDEGNRQNIDFPTTAHYAIEEIWHVVDPIMSSINILVFFRPIFVETRNPELLKVHGMICDKMDEIMAAATPYQRYLWTVKHKQETDEQEKAA